MWSHLFCITETSSKIRDTEDLTKSADKVLGKERLRSLISYKEEMQMSNEILSAVSDQVFSVWFLIGAALVFWMQAGFAMVETGFTRAKNAV